MTHTFYKYQGTGNDFILIDDRSATFDLTNKNRIAKLCDRHFGIGADGLLLLREAEAYDFEMIYFNADGARGSMCGNGARCISRFAADLGIIKQSTVSFLAYDGPHLAELHPIAVKLKMNDVHSFSEYASDLLVDTGSPHFIRFVTDIHSMNVYELGRAIRYSEPYTEKGVNANFVQINGNGIYVRTYERGVENETLSCGTGVTAAALAAVQKGEISNSGSCTVETPGGNLIVHYKKETDRYTNVWLEGPADFVFKGELTI